MQLPRKTVDDTVEIVQAILSGNKRGPNFLEECRPCV